ncbi:MAG: transketolase [Desulfobacca sp.]|uniref:transketolase n=1 Tax=Desulfobacca sp. TaxID=2067990 RepID=UPI0040497C01
MPADAATLLQPASALDELCINTIRFLAVDAVQQAHSGHPGMPMGDAAMGYTLWDRFLKFNPRDPHWPNRDRFVLSAGHGCMLLYALLYLYGYDLPIEEIKNFRQLGSITPGHAEHGKTPGVEVTSGPLGQGFANAVGLAMAEAAMAATYNRPGFPIIDHFTYVIASDGDIMEGVSAEAASLAGHLQLGKLIVLWSDNRITIEGGTDLTFTEDVLARFAAYGWQVQRVYDGNDLSQVAAALIMARAESQRPSFIAVRTHIGYGSPHKQDTAAAHGEPLGREEVQLTKQQLGWPLEPAFLVPEQVLEHCRRAIARGQAWQEDWQRLHQAYAREFPDLAQELERRLHRQLPPAWDRDIPVFQTDHSPVATRSASGQVLNAIAPHLPELLGGSGDLAPSTKTLIKKGGTMQATHPCGRNIHFGIREHAMGAIVNGLAYYGGFLPYSATFLVFSDYMRPPIRLAALSRLHSIFIFTHDSLGVGEDGPTHQPVEHLLALRAIPGLLVIRPADANETAAAWRLAISHLDGPVVLVLSRQNLPILDPADYPHVLTGVSRGGYILAEAPAGGTPQLIMVATGSEVHLALAAREALADEGIQARVVSFPCWELFQKQPLEYQQEVCPPEIPLLAIEAGVSLGWQPYIWRDSKLEVVAVDRFGASAPGATVLREYGFNLKNVCQRASSLLARAQT